MKLSTFKSPSKIQFEVSPSILPRQPTIVDAKRGDVFLLIENNGRHDNPVCMKVHLSVFKVLTLDAEQVNRDIDNAHFVVNLQTGRVFAVTDLNTEILFVKTKMIVEGFDQAD